jgi:hypothetical protein
MFPVKGNGFFLFCPQPVDIVDNVDNSVYNFLKFYIAGGFVEIGLFYNKVLLLRRFE